MEDEITAFKVVEKRTRFGTNYMIFKKMISSKRNDLKVNHEDKIFFPKYKKNSIIKAFPDSAGICCFESIYDAISFANHEVSDCDWIIITVKGKRRVKYPILYSGFGLIAPKSFSYRIKEYIKMEKEYKVPSPEIRKLPRGFISFEEIKVLT